MIFHRHKGYNRKSLKVLVKSNPKVNLHEAITDLNTQCSYNYSDILTSSVRHTISVSSDLTHERQYMKYEIFSKNNI